ncbi:MAG: hypothetical protein IIZ27_00805 [Solobacterium sp.]|nr:hypothetical protein [Solobacterium sp.]
MIIFTNTPDITERGFCVLHALCEDDQIHVTVPEIFPGIDPQAVPGISLQGIHTHDTGKIILISKPVKYRFRVIPGPMKQNTLPFHGREMPVEVFQNIFNLCHLIFYNTFYSTFPENLYLSATYGNA